MSVSEQEAKQQIAQMRQALESMRASARRASYVRILGVIVGFVIVIIYVVLFIQLGHSVMTSKKFGTLVKQRIEMARPQQVLEAAVKDALPAYFEEGKKMVQEMDLGSVLQTQATALATDVQPVLSSELDRAWPRMQTVALREADLTTQQLQTNLQGLLDERMADMIRKHTDSVAQQTGLSEDKVAQVLANIIDANQAALLNIVQKRWGANNDRLAEIANLVDQLPPLPPMSEEELLQHTGRTLMAVLGYKLVENDYDLAVEMGQRSAQLKAPGMNPQQMIEQIQETLKKPDLPAEARTNLQRQLDDLKAQMAAGGSTATGPTPEQLVRSLETALKQPNLSDEDRARLQKQLDEAKAKVKP